MREALALVLAFFRRRHFVVGARLRLVLPELLLGGGDQAEIMLGVLVVVLGRDRIAGRARVARQLDVFFRDVGGGAADLDVGSVRFEHPGHRVLTAPVIVVVVIVVIIPVTHPLVVSDRFSCLAFIPALKLCSCRRSLIARPKRGQRASGAPNHDAVQIHVVDFANHRVQQRRVPQPPAYIRPPDQIIQPAKTSPIVLRDGFA